MFNMDVMKAGAEAFGRVVESIERQTNILYAMSIRNNFPCPHKEVIGGNMLTCGLPAGHPPEHIYDAPKIRDDERDDIDRHGGYHEYAEHFADPDPE